MEKAPEEEVPEEVSKQDYLPYYLGGFITIIIGLTIYTVKTNANLPNDQRSQDKMTNLNEAFRAILGNHWPYVLLVFTVLLAVLIGMIYVISEGEGLKLSLEENSANRLNSILFWMLIIWGIFMLVLCIKMFLNRNQTGIPGYMPDVIGNQKAQIVLVILVSLLVIFYGLWFLYTRTVGAP